MTTLDSIILGAVQGITEFLPVSSDGHLSVFQYFMGLTEHNLSFDIAVHFGTLLSVLTVYRKTLFQITSQIFSFLVTRKMNASARLAALVVVASVPAAVVGIGFKEFFEQLFTNIHAAIFGFVVTGFFLIMTAVRGRGQMGSHFVEHLENVHKISFAQAIAIGAAQAAAIAPGISRSGLTISTGLILGLDRSTAAFFSFMMAIPVIAGAVLLEARTILQMQPEDLRLFAVGVVTSYFVGLLGLKLVLTFVRQGRLHYFAFYVWALAAYLYIKVSMGG
jgi:undecaprenyl-diphosphatase